MNRNGVILKKSSTIQAILSEDAIKNLTKIKTVPRIKPLHEDIPYNLHWGFLDYGGKRVLDIGADCGSTADFFLQLGAWDVIAVEGDEKFYEELLKNSKIISGIIPVKMFIDSSQSIVNLLETYKPDIVKIDIEYYEILLNSVPDDKLTLAKDYVIECHVNGVCEILEDKFSKNFDVTTCVFHPARVFYAKLREK